MAINYEDVNDKCRRIYISGRLDTYGTYDLANDLMSAIATAMRNVIVDLTSVSFLSSIAIRTLIANAKALQSHGYRMVLVVGKNTSVDITLHTAGVEVLIPIFSDAAEAEKTVLA
jgi:anti-anti-sigma factor